MIDHFQIQFQTMFLFLVSYLLLTNQIATFEFIETNMHFSLYCLLFGNQRCTLLITVMILIALWPTLMTQYWLIFFSLVSLDITTNTLIINATMNYSISTQIWSKFVLLFCNFYVNVYLSNFFPYPNVLFQNLHSYFT